MENDKKRGGSAKKKWERYKWRLPSRPCIRFCKQGEAGASVETCKEIMKSFTAAVLILSFVPAYCM